MIYQDTNTPHCPPALFYTLVSSNSFWLQVFQSWIDFGGIQQFLSKILPGNWAKAMGHYYPDHFRRAASTCFQTFQASALYLPGASRLVHLTLANSYTFIPHPLQPSWAKPARWGTHHLQHPYSQSPLGPEAVEIFSELCTTTSRLCNNHFFLLRFLPPRYPIL